MNNSSEQNDELFSVESIFNVYEKNLTFEEKNPPCGRFKANVWLPTPFYVTYKVEDLENSTKTEKFEVKYLPPINLFFELPETYPSDTCPAFLLSCNWLTLQQLSNLCKHLESMWDKDLQILYSWCQFLESEVTEFLDLQQCLDITDLLTFRVSDNFRSLTQDSIKSVAGKSEDSFAGNSKAGANAEAESFPVIKPSISGGSSPIDCRAFNDLTDGRSLIQLLKNYNEFKTRDIFNQKYHECDICLTSKIGTEFVFFKTCNHTFCKECLKGFFEAHILEGNVSFLSCPSTKCTSQADGSMVRQIVDKDLFKRYDGILLSRTLETMADIAYCPRKWCQCAVVIDSEERMGSCPSCYFVFCPDCKMAYHGVAPCVFKAENEKDLYERYMSGDAEEKERLERRYGTRAIKAPIEDKLSESWKHSNSKFCPQCNASIEKNGGCNQMTCFKCGAFFCWRSMALLD